VFILGDAGRTEPDDELHLMHARVPALNLRGVALPVCVASAVVVAAATALSGSAHAARSQAAQVQVLPFPGTPDASPQTEIDFPTLAWTQLASLTVAGSRSGGHRGSLGATGAGRGTAFRPSRPFTAGEQVSVKATLRNANQVSFAFTIARPVPMRANAATTAAAENSGAVDGATGVIHASRRAHASADANGFTRSFRSEPWLHPPVVSASGNNPDPGSGDIVLDAHKSIQAGPLILDAQGRPIWFNPLPGGQAGFNTMVQTYKGRSYLTYWQGYVSGGVGSGQDVMLNHSYEVVKTVNAANGYKADLHEFAITPDGNAVITIYSPVQADLRSVGGSRNGMLLDSIVEEINIASGRLLWEWHAYGHVHIAESYAGRPGASPYDFFHISSVQLLPNGNFLISGRHMFAVYQVNPATGKIVWTLGGKHSTFRIGSGANFSWQHDAMMQPNGDLMLFDNGAGYHRTESQSRGLRIRLSTSKRQATLVRQYAHTPPVVSVSEGSVQRLSNGNVFVGFGNNPVFAEYTQAGRQFWSGGFRSPVQFHRAFRIPWSASPDGVPYAAASPTSSGTVVYASWNGATNIASWRLLAGPSPGALQAVTSRASNGFETGVSTSSTQAYFAVQALDSSGRVLGTSAAVPR
jgi:Arylsulfotransferase (ASST)